MGDARKHLSTIIDDVLEKYPQVVLERRGTPVAVISRPETVDSPVVEEEF
jgi:PHD/YefM family antitoxin component YafN of YafNO toxin-antitoxin module